MDLYSRLQREFDYDDWANREVIAALRQPNPPLKALRLMAHIVATEFVWLARLNGEADPAVWPEWGFEETERQQGEIARKMKEYLLACGPAGLGREVEYKNTKGARWQNWVADILTHVVMLSAFHRGQIAMVLRDAGLDPAYTDYIHAVRTKSIPE
jgi:uncharacterized damage-inducible protein DinB